MEMNVLPFPFRWEPREQTDQASAPQTAVSHGLGSGHGEAVFPHVHATTVDTPPPEAEDGPSGEQRRLIYQDMSPHAICTQGRGQ